MIEKFFTTEQVANILQVHPFTILKFIKSGKLNGIKLGRVYRIKESDVNEFVEAQMTKPRTSKKKKTSSENIENQKVEKQKKVKNINREKELQRNEFHENENTEQRNAEELERNDNFEKKEIEKKELGIEIKKTEKVKEIQNYPEKTNKPEQIVNIEKANDLKQVDNSQKELIEEELTVENNIPSIAPDRNTEQVEVIMAKDREEELYEVIPQDNKNNSEPYYII